MVQTLRIPTVLFRRTGIIQMKRSMHLEFLLLEISMVEIGYSPLVPTAFDRNIFPISFKKWWLRSPIMDDDYSAWRVDPSGSVYDISYNYYVSNSYGRTLSRRAQVILSVRSSSIFPVTPASTMVVLILSTFPTGLSA